MSLGSLDAGGLFNRRSRMNCAPGCAYVVSDCVAFVTAPTLKGSLYDTDGKELYSSTAVVTVTVTDPSNGKQIGTGKTLSGSYTYTVTFTSDVPNNNIMNVNYMKLCCC